MTASSGAGIAVRVHGLVQGVGFRPTVWRLAVEEGLCGDVCNDGEGVLIRLWGAGPAHERFLARLAAEVPPLARIDDLSVSGLAEIDAPAGFRIIESGGGKVRTHIVPDAASCPECIRETRDPGDRRFGYAFTNCTHCGPRFSIIRAIPYDRDKTSMAPFPLCPRCRTEYEDPADRRFHAQPNACPVCGPRLELTHGTGEVTATGSSAIGAAAGLIRAGEILAIKGLGGFHLACDALAEPVVAELRRRKRRYGKPFALMAADAAMIERFCTIEAPERELLEDRAAPIVLLSRRGPEMLAESVAPGVAHLGFMLPYTPLHHLLMRALDGPIVLTSGNLSHQPQVIDDAVARSTLSGIADAFLGHDRAIVSRVDDSVVRVIAGAPAPIRRARGYAPEPFVLPRGFDRASPMLAYGAHLKNTFCLLAEGRAVVSQHMGDLDLLEVREDVRRQRALYARLYEHTPEVLVADAHPGYASTQSAVRRAREEGLPLESVYHHHAHIAACMVENGLEIDAGPVLGVALDGLGYGPNGALWGGELLVVEYADFERLAGLLPMPLIGGEKAMEEPWRNAFAYLHALGWDWVRSEYANLPIVTFLEGKPLKTVMGMLATGANVPTASSTGRLFDAVAAALGLYTERTDYEGQAAVALEALVDRAALEDAPYPFAVIEGEALRLSAEPMWRALLADLRRGTERGVVAARFHAGLASAWFSLCRQVSVPADRFEAVALSGGCFQNATLTELLSDRLIGAGYRVLRHTRFPAGDGAISLGQAAVAAARQTGEFPLSGELSSR